MTKEDAELVRETHWRHLQQQARRQAIRDNARMTVLAQPWSYRGWHGWHYVVVPATHPIALARRAVQR
jgi:hypothetical protein